MAHLYLREDLRDAEPGGEVELVGAEARHLVTVSRGRVGERISVANGAGLLVTGEIVSADPARVVVRADAVTRVPQTEPRVVLVQALAKGGRDELAVQTAVELGADEIVPWQASRSIARWNGDKVRKGAERWSAIAREAAKQSMRSWVPAVTDPVDLKALAARAAHSRMLVLEPGASRPLTGIRIEAGDVRDLVLVVGPEGGVSPEESRRLAEAGAEPVRLGDAVLRTSSAGPAAIAVLNAVLGRW